MKSPSRCALGDPTPGLFLPPNGLPCTDQADVPCLGSQALSGCFFTKVSKRPPSPSPLSLQLGELCELHLPEDSRQTTGSPLRSCGHSGQSTGIPCTDLESRKGCFSDGKAPVSQGGGATRAPWPRKLPSLLGPPLHRWPRGQEGEEGERGPGVLSEGGTPMPVRAATSAHSQLAQVCSGGHRRENWAIPTSPEAPN